ncbi:Transgelin [Taphrina deformans PYCC 5710]|uniref:Transgelin n=1 Tax=Taphrina deformans (strain PYCC 5710 / ATCC 11124 / CBS 356.35 / IMI 108563 / JCM 9778 / NBRC 8474) TaxID=1097556 RepID=R4XCA5_TAPDE|nr:Transgelin [Taphrina deformans PYCC 5710]|eukprot:CCG82006.1 Transgelin [Taphrina deformans PYCC 5710]
MSFDRDLRAKEKAKYDDRYREMESDARSWLEEVLERSLSAGPGVDLCETLRDGTVLCELANKIAPGSTRSKRSAMPFVQMENIASFLAFCTTRLHVPQHDLFQTVDLFEAKNRFQVVSAIHTVSRYAVQQGHLHARFLGPKMATSTNRDFTDQQLRDAKNTVNTFQYGKFSGSGNVLMSPRRDPAGHFH